LKKVDLKQKVVSENQALAASNRERFARDGSFVVNLVSSPGSGKTSLVEETVKRLKDNYRILVLAGDLMTENDAARVRRHGVEAIQICTGEACHLDASMVSRHLPGPESKPYDLVIVENVGNLVCPASFDLGEDLKVLLISVTEGDDKPLKYPPMVLASKMLVITKMDLVPYTDSNPDEMAGNARSMNPDLGTFRLSSKTGEGLDQWIQWLRCQLAAKKQTPARS
jgi:hydrogenase nickel incorporation protein HypB